MRYFAFDIFSDCIPNELSKELHSKWYIRKPVVQPSLKSSENVAVGVKRELQVKASSTTKVRFLFMRTSNLFIFYLEVSQFNCEET